MNLLCYEFITGPDDSINGMLRTLVKDLRYNRSMVTIDDFKEAMPNLRRIERQLQQLDSQIGNSQRNYIDEIMQELDEESENEVNIDEDLRKATYAMNASFLDQQINFDDFAFSTGKAEHYRWLRFSGYVDQRSIDANLLITKEVFRSICNKYNYIFIDLS